MVLLTFLCATPKRNTVTMLVLVHLVLLFHAATASSSPPKVLSTPGSVAVHVWQEIHHSSVLVNLMTVLNALAFPPSKGHGRSFGWEDLMGKVFTNT